jgi:2-oxoglutarate/2-oxoacid ferredoxin oxidoreductase subunit beta
LLALQLGATFVAPSFSDDKAQLVPLTEAAITHQGAAFIDVISSYSGVRSSLRVTH